MRVLFDHTIPRGIASSLKEHDVTVAVGLGWESISNGKLLAQAEASGFDVMLTAGKNIRYQQNLKNRRIAIVLLTNPTWRDVLPYVERVVTGITPQRRAATPRLKSPFPPRSLSREPRAPPAFYKGSFVRHDKKLRHVFKPRPFVLHFIECSSAI